MICTSISVAAPMAVTGITAAMSTDPAFPAANGWVLVTVSATGQGTFSVSVDGTEVKRQTGNAGTGSSWGFQIQMTQNATHNVCAQVI